MHTIFWVKIELGYLNVCSTAFLSCSLQFNPIVGGGLWFFVMDTILAVHQLLFSKREGGISKVDHMTTNTVPPVQLSRVLQEHLYPQIISRFVQDHYFIPTIIT